MALNNDVAFVTGSWSQLLRICVRQFRSTKMLSVFKTVPTHMVIIQILLAIFILSTHSMRTS